MDPRPSRPDIDPLPPAGRYALMIDARSPREYADDHIPGAINLPVVDNDQYAEVGTLHRDDTHRAYLIGVEHSLRNMADHLRDLIARFGPDDRILVYCFRGGKRSRLWNETLRIIGFRVDILPGGWKNYRRAVLAALDDWPQRIPFRVLVGATGCGKTRLLTALRAVGAQVLDLEAIACHRGSRIGALPGQGQPGQKYFDSLVLEALRSLDLTRPVWVEAESKRIGQVQLSESLHRAIHEAPVVRLETPMAQRVQLWREDYAHWAENPLAMVACLQPLRPLVGGEALQRWHDLASAGDIDTLFASVMTEHYDRAYQRTTRRHFPSVERTPLVSLDDLSATGLEPIAQALHARAADLHETGRQGPEVAH